MISRGAGGRGYSEVHEKSDSSDNLRHNFKTCVKTSDNVAFGDCALGVGITV